MIHWQTMLPPWKSLLQITRTCQRVTNQTFSTISLAISWHDAGKRCTDVSSIRPRFLLSHALPRWKRMPFEGLSQHIRIQSRLRNIVMLCWALLMSMGEEGQIESVVMSRCPDRKFRSTLPHLLPAFDELVKKKLEAKEPEANRGLGACSEATCYEFHQLVVATLLAYSNSLDTFCAAEWKLSMKKTENAAVMKDKDGRRMQGSEGMEEGDEPTVADVDADGSKPKFSNSPETLEDLIGLRNECAEQLWGCNFLLWRIAYSPIFCHHLVLLREGGLLHMQAKGHAELDPTQLRLSTSFSCPRHKRAAGSYDRDKDAGIGKGEEKHGDVDDEDPEGLDEEFWFMRATSVNTNLDETFKIWLQLQVCEWAALEIVSSFTRKLPAVSARYSNPPVLETAKLEL